MLVNNEYQADSPISYTVEEGEISSGGTSSANTVDNTAQTMDMAVQTTSPQAELTPESLKPQNLIVKIDNSDDDKPVKYTSLSDKRKNIAAKAKGQFTHQEVQFHPIDHPIAPKNLDTNQMHITPMFQSTPIINSPNLVQTVQLTLQQHYYTNPYVSNSNNPYTNPPLPIFPPPTAFNPQMPPQQFPDPPVKMITKENMSVHNRLGKPTSPIVEHYNQVQRGEISRTRPNNLRFPNAGNTKK